MSNPRRSTPLAAHPHRQRDRVDDLAVLGADLERLQGPGVGAAGGVKRSTPANCPRPGAPSAAVAWPWAMTWPLSSSRRRRLTVPSCTLASPLTTSRLPDHGPGGRLGQGDRGQREVPVAGQRSAHGPAVGPDLDPPHRRELGQGVDQGLERPARQRPGPGQVDGGRPAVDLHPAQAGPAGRGRREPGQYGSPASSSPTAAPATALV